MLVVWEALAQSGCSTATWCRRSFAIGRALYELLRDPTFYLHLYATFYEIVLGMVIGGV